MPDVKSCQKIFRYPEQRRDSFEVIRSRVHFLRGKKNGQQNQHCETNSLIFVHIFLGDGEVVYVSCFECRSD